MARTKKDPTSWRYSAAGCRSYQDARADAQQRANRTGHDHGLEANDLFKSYSVFMLPARQYRCGHELRCEVVSPEAPAAGGHGPGGESFTCAATGTRVFTS